MVSIDAGVHVEGPPTGRKAAHFRSEAATLLLDEQIPPDSLVLRGVIRQSTYPGGFYRYAVNIGDYSFMVDDQRRVDPGENRAGRPARWCAEPVFRDVAEGEKNETAQ